MKLLPDEAHILGSLVNIICILLHIKYIHIYLYILLYIGKYNNNINNMYYFIYLFILIYNKNV